MREQHKKSISEAAGAPNVAFVAAVTNSPKPPAAQEPKAAVNSCGDQPATVATTSASS